MLVYRYIIDKQNEKYLYWSDALETSGENELFFNSLKWDRNNRFDIPQENRIVFLFNTKISMDTFAEGIYTQLNLDKIFNNLPNTLEILKEQSGDDYPVYVSEPKK